MLVCNYVYKTVFIDICMHIHFIHIHVLFLIYITLWGKLRFNCIDGETEAIQFQTCSISMAVRGEPNSICSSVSV